VLEQDGVAEHQVGRDEAGHLVDREVPRHHAEQRADRLLGDHGAAALDRQRLVGEQRRALLGVVLEDVDDDADLAPALVDPFAHLQRHDRRQFVGPLGEQLRSPGDDRGAFGHRPPPPGREPGVHPPDRGPDLLVAGVLDLLDQFTRRRVCD
jgi:hypothetical protein